MEKDLRTLFDGLTQETLSFIKSLEEDKYDDLALIAARRQNIIDDMQTLKFTKGEFGTLYSEFGLEEKQQKLDLLFQVKRDEIKNGIADLLKIKNAKQNYAKHFDVDSLFFNKKI